MKDRTISVQAADHRKPGFKCQAFPINFECKPIDSAGDCSSIRQRLNMHRLVVYGGMKTGTPGQHREIAQPPLFIADGIRRKRWQQSGVGCVECGHFGSRSTIEQVAPRREQFVDS